ncbi:hypothetical protein BH10BDE1_BH10BDE1_28200 [soil metagenome]
MISLVLHTWADPSNYLKLTATNLNSSRGHPGLC